jgi:hypothetical protein
MAWYVMMILALVNLGCATWYLVTLWRVKHPFPEMKMYPENDWDEFGKITVRYRRGPQVVDTRVMKATRLRCHAGTFLFDAEETHAGTYKAPDADELDWDLHDMHDEHVVGSSCAWVAGGYWVVDGTLTLTFAISVQGAVPCNRTTATHGYFKSTQRPPARPL